MTFRRAKRSHDEGRDGEETVAGGGGPVGGVTPRPAAGGGRLRAYLRDRVGSWGAEPGPGGEPVPPHTLMHATATPWPRRQGGGAAAAPSTLLRSEFGETRLAQEIGLLLASLGSTPGELAGSLESAGVRARPGDPAGSPVRLFLAAVVGADPNVKSVQVDGDALVVDLRAWWRPTISVPVPPVVRSFEGAFEAGCYPSLEPGEGRAVRPAGDGAGPGAGASASKAAGRRKGGD
jgi:hypothetical protein